MNRAFRIVCVSILCLCFKCVVHAQNLVAFPQGDAGWKVEISPQASANTAPPVAAPAHPVHVEVTQLNKVKRIEITWSDGKKTEKWVIPGLPVVFNEDPRDGTVRPRQYGGPAEAADNAAFTYDSFAFTWITPQCLQEKDPISYKGKQCFHYLGSITVTFPVKRAPMKREAWIDASTLLPVALNTDDMQSVFTFQDPPPTGTLTPPPAFQKEITYYKIVMGYP